MIELIKSSDGKSNDGFEISIFNNPPRSYIFESRINYTYDYQINFDDFFSFKKNYTKMRKFKSISKEFSKAKVNFLGKVVENKENIYSSIVRFEEFSISFQSWINSGHLKIIFTQPGFIVEKIYPSNTIVKIDNHTIDRKLIDNSQLIDLMIESIMYENRIKSILKTKEISEILELQIEDLDFSIRTHNCLKRAGINIVKDFERFSHIELRNIRNLGRKSLNEVMFELNEIGIKLLSDEEGVNDD